MAVQSFLQPAVLAAPLMAPLPKALRKLPVAATSERGKWNGYTVPVSCTFGILKIPRLALLELFQIFAFLSQGKNGNGFCCRDSRFCSEC